MPANVFIAAAHGLGSGMIYAATAYALLALIVTLKHRWTWRPSTNASALRPVSVLKPLYGADSHLFENLRGFCLQAHPQFQLVFGLREADDYAAGIVRQLAAAFPHVDIALVISPTMHGSNPKVSNLINMLPHAKYDWLVLADSDISVPTDYLTRVTAPLSDPTVGIVTCLYRGIARNGLWSRLGRLFIDDWFAPSVWLSHSFGSTRFGFGSTIAIRRDGLHAIGGLESIQNSLADDFWLGELTRRQGLRTVLSDLVIGTDVSETNFTSLWLHELRWLRTIRSLAPWGFALTCVCFTSPMLLLGLILAAGAHNWIVAAVGMAARLLLYFYQRRFNYEASPWHEVLLVPLRDGLLFLEWATALTGWQVTWQGQILLARGSGTTSHH